MESVLSERSESKDRLSCHAIPHAKCPEPLDGARGSLSGVEGEARMARAKGEMPVARTTRFMASEGPHYRRSRVVRSIASCFCCSF